MRYAIPPKVTPEGRAISTEARLTSREYRQQRGPWLKEWAAEKRDARVFGPAASEVEFEVAMVRPVRRRSA